jgi:hypothetical protein
LRVVIGLVGEAAREAPPHPELQRV